MTGKKVKNTLGSIYLSFCSRRFHFTLGQTVQLIGRLNDYRGKRQLTIKQKYLVGPLEEIVHGLEAAKLDEYYRLPYQLFPSSEHSDHQNDEDPFECALLAYWRENLNDIHSFKQACKDTALVELAHRLFSEITAGQVKEKDVIDLFSSTTKALARDGHLALAGPLDYGVFRLMSSQELQKTVLSIVDEIYKLSNHDDGVHKKYIIERFHDFPAYALVPESTITSTINSLLDQGVLYESQYNVYKVVV
ncbi:hypothetical protein CLU79DRAFT_775778 [Phycomyces nitens]|nr:hypothetical protein CLU79DRAFT_775778 [Phycomyces nitens]